MVHIESEAESHADLIIDEPAEEPAKGNEAQEEAMQSASVNLGETPLRMDGQAPMEIEQVEE